MKRNRLMLALFISGLAGYFVFFLSTRSEATQPNALICSLPRHDFGTFVARGTDLQHTFVLKNTGATSIRIVKIETTCGCTAVQASMTDVSGHAETNLNVTAHWWNRSGLRSEQIKVITEPPGKAPLVLMVTGNALRSMASSTTYIDFGRLPPGLAAPHEIIFYPGADGTVPKLGPPSVKSSLIIVEKVELSPSERATNVAKYAVTLNAPRQAGSFDNIVLFSAADSPRNVIPIKIHADFAGAIVPSSPSLFFDAANVGEKRSLKLNLPVTEAPLNITVKPLDAQKMFRMTFELIGQIDSPMAEVHVEYVGGGPSQHPTVAFLDVMKGGDAIRVPMVVGLKVEPS